MKRKNLLRKVTGLLLSMSLLCSSAYTVMANNDIKVTIDGQQIAFDVPPQLINDRTMVPLRAIFEALNATVDWNDETQTVTSTKDDTTIQLTINNPTMYVNGASITLDSPACLINDRTLVPVRAISEAFKTNVDWDNDTKTVIISVDGSAMPQVSYDDISTNVNQINSMITNGQYLEAITECEQTLAWHTLSDDDKSILANLKNTAQTKYNEYEESRLSGYAEIREILNNCRRYVSYLYYEGSILEINVDLFRMTPKSSYLIDIVDDVSDISDYFSKIKNYCSGVKELYPLYLDVNYEIPIITSNNTSAAKTLASRTMRVKTSYNILCGYYGGEKIE